MPSRRRVYGTLFTWTLLACAVVTSAVNADDAVPKSVISIQHSTGAIVVDGNLDDAGWTTVAPETTWYETNVTDNTTPPVKTVGYLTYDDHYLYAAFRLDDPNPSGVRGPLGDHDALPGSTDYCGLVLDSHNDGKTAQLFLANFRGVQYDAITSDATGEDSAPDFFWDAQGKLVRGGWTLEMRIPFSSLRYDQQANPTWGILMYRNYPRDRHYQMFTARQPRSSNCFVCNSSKLVGLADLPHGSHFVVAPFATASQASAPRSGPGSPMKWKDPKTAAGLDIKWSPASGLAIDATVKPDFSQVESDAAQIVANERFALFFAEKRPFFLEGVDLLSTPMNAVYTRTITSPDAGLRATGKIGSTAYTALVTQDHGGGNVILPGPEGSGFAHQDFVSDVGIFRARRDIGPSFVSMLVTGRVIQRGGDYSGALPKFNWNAAGDNMVLGPDFQWRPRGTDAITGQALWSRSHTPRRTDLADEWDGRELSDHAAQLGWSHSGEHADWYLQGQDIGDEFRADDGFIPQVGYREGYAEAGYTLRPKDKFLSRVRLFSINLYDADLRGDALSQRITVGAGMDGRWNSFCRVELNREHFRVGEEWLQRFRPRIQLQASPGRVLNSVTVDAYFGDEIDFENGRKGSGATLLNSVLVRPNAHLELRGNANVRWLNVRDTTGTSGRLFLATVERLRATWSFNSRSFVRVINQYVETRREPSRYLDTVEKKSAGFAASALFAYKLNWQTVLFAGYGDSRTFDDASNRLQRSGNQTFAKISYALQQ